MMKEMTQRDMVVGNLVAPLPSHVNEGWARGRKWPQQIADVPNPFSFRLSDSSGGWVTTGLYVIDNSIQENE